MPSMTHSTVEFVNPTTGQKVLVEAGYFVTVDENGFISEPQRGSPQLGTPESVGKNNNDGVIDTSPSR